MASTQLTLHIFQSLQYGKQFCTNNGVFTSDFPTYSPIDMWDVAYIALATDGNGSFILDPPVYILLNCSEFSSIAYNVEIPMTISLILCSVSGIITYLFIASQGGNARIWDVGVLLLVSMETISMIFFCLVGKKS